ncbi:MAG TPA: hypothetical protein PKE45_09700, partial [Caldilineaceae bacterium]|nr:hypothetical protein [Caldilineaceae bacterium]
MLETDDLDGFLAPGQSLQYTNTVIAYTAMAPGVLNVTPPSILGAARNPLAMTFDPLTFTSTQTVTQAISLTVAQGIGTQQTRITSTASTRLKDTAPAGWTFAPVIAEAPLGGIVAPNLPYYTDVTAVRPDRQDNFQIAALAFDSLGPIGRGDILDYSIPGGGMRAVENDASNTAAFMGNAAPSMATNANGDTLVVWGQQRFCNTITFNSLKVVTAGADGQDGSEGIEPVIALTPYNGSESIVWRWDTAGGTSMTSGQQRGPNASGFPLTVTYCNGPAALTIYDVDGATNQLVQTQSVDIYAPQNGVRTFTGAGITIQVNTTVPLTDTLVIAGALVGPDGQVKRSITFPRSPVPTSYVTGNFGPAVASEGSGFLVAYESYAQNSSGGAPGNPQIAVQAFDKAGNPIANSSRDALSTQASTSQENNLALAATWIGYAYRLVWQDRRAPQVYIADVERGGSSITAALPIYSNALTNEGPNYGPAVAYDPISGRTLTVLLSDVRRVIGLLYATGTPIGNPLVLSTNQFPAGRSPQVAWHPNYHGWLVSYQDNAASQRHVFIPVNSDGARAFPPITG